MGIIYFISSGQTPWWYLKTIRTKIIYINHSLKSTLDGRKSVFVVSVQCQLCSVYVCVSERNPDMMTYSHDVSPMNALMSYYSTSVVWWGLFRCWWRCGGARVRNWESDINEASTPVGTLQKTSNPFTRHDPVSRLDSITPLSYTPNSTPIFYTFFPPYQ